MAADTYTGTLGAILMGTGNDNNAWGSNLNNLAIQIFEDAIANVLTSAVAGGTLDLSTNPPPNAASPARYYALVFTGALTSNQIVKVPNLTKSWWVQNQTSGSAFTLTLKTPSGVASTAIPQNGGWQFVQCDGNNNIIVSPFNSQQIQMPDGSASAPAYSDISEPRSGWYRNAAQDWRLSVNGADVLQVTGTGAGTASVVNVLSPNVLQVAGVQYVPPGTEVAFAGITAPSGWYLEYGQLLSRTTDAPLFNALTATATGNTHSNTTVDGLSADLRGLGLEGAFIEGTGVSLGTTIASINSATSLTLSQAATGTGTGVSLRILPWGQGDGSTTFAIPDRRDTSLFGRGNMGGTAKNQITGVSTTHLNAAGGAETTTIPQSALPNVAPTFTGNPVSLGTISLNQNDIVHGQGSIGGSFTQGGPGWSGTGEEQPNVTIPAFTPSGTISSINGNVTQTTISRLAPMSVSNFIIKR